jgi:hypothetical protein
MIAIIQIGSGLRNPALGEVLNSPQVLIIDEEVDGAETITFTFFNGVQATVPVNILRSAPVLIKSIDSVTGGVNVNQLWIGKA